ncbi:MAG: dTDP-4-amino-4,6-dideoxygalactose transaminase [Planctomycetota bacterium]|nr:dTDP-4-amino-4,6-dideoxygalactose transaminase [Planctomycetota bacterium]MDA1212720.1 dTDP-4-amino-4,6-dideoxygalactose transaminase [Planctomycetota bacterium]
MPISIPFNKPFIAGKELYYIAQAVTFGNLAGDGPFTKRCAETLEERFGIGKVLMTPSCTASLEMAAMLCGLGPGDEVILPSYTFVSTANAIVRTGARPVFVDVRPDTLNIDETLIEEAITEKTKAIFVVHYAGVGCEMDRIMAIAEGNRLKVVEDAAQGVNAYYQKRALGSIGHIGTYSFHETKNVICGEGGAICLNDPDTIEQAEIIRDKGTNRQRFFRGEVDKYTWVSQGSSHVPSEICSAFLYGQLELIDEISQRRNDLFQNYWRHLQPCEAKYGVRLPRIPPECESNFHIFYLIMPTPELRSELIEWLKSRGVHAVFHYVPLHTSPMGMSYGYRQGDLPVTENLSERLVRLPMYFELSSAQQMTVIEAILEFLQERVPVTTSAPSVEIQTNETKS